jgi:hypothetical protein
VKKSFQRKALLLATCVSAYALGAFVSVWAQSVPQSGVTPAPPSLPDYAPKGLPLGAFRLFPTLEVAFDADDNIYRTNEFAKADTFWEIIPRVALQSQWSRHYLALRGGATAYEYNNFNSESRVDWDIDADGRLDVVQGSALFGGASYRRTFEPRSSPDQQNFAAEPTPFGVTHGDVRFEYMPNRFGVIVGFNYDYYDYDATKLIGGGVSPNDDRDYAQYDSFVRLLYEFSPGYSVFGHFAYNVRDFRLALDRNNANRDSTGYRANVGLQMELTRLITGEFYAGYMEQDYTTQSPVPLGDDSGFNYGAEITWTPDPLFTIRLGASHLINETVVSSIAGVATDSNEQRFSLGVDWSIRRNIIIHGDVAYLHDNFTGSGRKDDVGLASVGISYLMNSYISANFRYIYQNRDSNIVGQDYGDNILRIGLGFQL